MKKNYAITICFSIALLSTSHGWAQQGTSAAGIEAAGAGGSVSATVGQMDYLAISGAGGSASEGIQQPYQIAVVTGMDEDGIDLNYSIYPNPTTDFVMLTVQNNDFKDLSYWLCDIKGRLIQRGKLTGNSTSISLSHNPDATYMVRIFNKNNEVKSFKVIKNK